MYMNTCAPHKMIIRCPNIVLTYNYIFPTENQKKIQDSDSNSDDSDSDDETFECVVDHFFEHKNCIGEDNA